MIYLARLTFLLGSVLMTVGILCLGLKVVFEPDMPEAFQGYWIDLFVMVGVGTYLAIVGQWLGSDLIGVGQTVKDAANNEYAL